MSLKDRVRSYESAISPHNLHLILFSTEQCNLRCEYCYEDYTVGRMSRDVVTGIKALLSKRANDLSSLVIEWFGGEPLLAKSVVLEVNRFASALVESHPHLRFSSNITTNAVYLTPETFSELVDAGVRVFHISLDGYGEVHDRTRRWYSGAGTFKSIWSNLIGIAKSKEDVVILLRLHYSRDSLDHMPKLISEIEREFAGDPRFLLYFHAIENLGGKTDEHRTPFSSSQQKAIINWLESKLTIPRMKWAQASDLQICYASSANSLAIRADGAVAKCTVALNDPINHLGTLSRDGSLEIDIDKYRAWIGGLEDLNSQRLACPLNWMIEKQLISRPALQLVNIT